MKLLSQSHLKAFKKLSAIMITGMVLAFAGCGGGGGTSAPVVISGTETVLYTFAGGTGDGANPMYGNLVQASDGDLYGLTYLGGSSNLGTMFRITTSGTETVPHFFLGGTAGGAYPYGSLIQASDGNLYGMASSGGASNGGAVVMIGTGGMTIIHIFAGGTTDGANPYGSLVQASDGYLYGMTFGGGTNGAGTVFRIPTGGGTLTVLHSFLGGTTDGANPYGSLIQASDGSLYGMTFGGGANNKGTVFKVTTDGTPAGTTVTVLHSFGSGTPDGANPYGSLIQASDGDLYGMTQSGGANNLGMVFRITTSGTLTMVLHSFAGGAADGASPSGSLIQASDGKLYGLTTGGGINNFGTVFKITTGGTETLLYSFMGDSLTPADGTIPRGSLIQARDGKLYGMTSSGGNGNGTVFKIQ